MTDNNMEEDEKMSWSEKFLEDMKNIKLLPMKGLMFLTYGANWALLPFLSLQARALGITGEEVGIIYSCLTIPALIAPTSIGLIADKIGNFRNMLIGITLLSAASPLLFTLIPQGRITHHLPDSVMTKLNCTSTNASFVVDDLHGCEHTHKKSFNMSLTSCYVTLPCHSERANLSELKNVACEFNSCSFDVTENLIPTNFTSTISNDEDIPPLPQNWATTFQPQSANNGTWVYQALSPFCPNLVGMDFQETCITVCEGKISRKEACTKTTYVEEFNPQLTFYLRLVIRFSLACTLATTMPLTEGALISIVKKFGGDFGLQRMYGNLGMMLMTPLAGVLVEQLSDGHSASSYNPAIYMYCVLKILAAFILLFVDLDFKPESSSVISDLWILLKRFEVVTFILIAFFAGQFYGFLETFLFWLLEDIGADRVMMGLTVTVGSGCGAFVLLFSSFIIKKLGYVNTIVFSFMCYIVRLVGYTMLSNPWAAMPFEAMEAFTNSLILVTFMAYSSHLASLTTIVTLQGIYQGLYHGVGRATGSMTGGYLIDLLGTKKAFRVLALASGVGGALYFVTHLIYRAVTSSNSPESVQEEKDADVKLENGHTPDLSKPDP